MKAFRDLLGYAGDSLSRLGDVDIVKKIAIKRGFPVVFGLCIAAQLYPEKFHIDRMKEFLSRRFPSVKKMREQGKGNVVGAFLQTKPPLLELMHGQFYRWAHGIDSRFAAAELTQLIKANFGEEPPSKDDLEAVRG
jgi:hypothetical protein